MAEAFGLLRAYARATGTHLTDVARRLMFDPATRPAILVGLVHHLESSGEPQR